MGIDTGKVSMMTIHSNAHAISNENTIDTMSPVALPAMAKAFLSQLKYPIL